MAWQQSQTYTSQFHVTDHLHNVQDLVGCDNAPSFTFGDDLLRHLVLLGLEDSSLMETYRGGMDRHIAKDDVRIGHASW
jgi:hypothetical protein